MKESGAVSPYGIKEKIKGLEKSDSFLEFARQHTQSFYFAGKIPYWKRWVGFCNKLEEFAKKNGMNDITFADISLDFLKRYETYLRSLRNERDGGRNLGANTVHSQLKLFRTLVREGQKSGRIKDNPFDLFSMSSERTVKEKLTKEEIERLSMHISRHSFAKAAKMKGIDNLSVKELLAQSSVAVTERYMGDFDTEQNDAALRKVFDEQSDLEKVRELLLALPDSVVESLLMERLGKTKGNN